MGLDIVVASIHGRVLGVDIRDRDLAILEQRTNGRVLIEESTIDHGVDRIGREAEHAGIVDAALDAPAHRGIGEISQIVRQVDFRDLDPDDILARHRDVLERTQAMVKIGERRWNLKLHNNVDVLLPEGHEAAAVRRLEELQREQRLLDRPIAAIDMRLPDRLVVRQLPQAAPPQPERGRSGRG